MWGHRSLARDTEVARRRIRREVALRRRRLLLVPEALGEDRRQRLGEATQLLVAQSELHRLPPERNA